MSEHFEHVEEAVEYTRIHPRREEKCFTGLPDVKFKWLSVADVQTNVETRIAEFDQ